MSPTRRLDAFVLVAHRSLLLLWRTDAFTEIPPVVLAHQPSPHRTDSDMDLGAEADVNARVALDDDEDEDDDAPDYVAGDVDVPEVNP